MSRPLDRANTFFSRAFLSIGMIFGGIIGWYEPNVSALPVFCLTWVIGVLAGYFVGRNSL